VLLAKQVTRATLKKRKKRRKIIIIIIIKMEANTLEWDE
jgi:phenylpyruvate tautomerase PptA (4-oxalocrotonate tautomerase family)